MSKTIVFFGTEDFSLAALQALVEGGFSVAAVVTKPDSPQGRGHKLTAPAVKTYALAHGITVLQPQKLTEITNYVTTLDNPAGVLVSYGKIIPQSIIDLFTPGIVNVHPSLLPIYRGPSPIETAILDGATQTGVSIMQLDAKMDAGPIYGQTTYNLQGGESLDFLYAELGFLGNKLLVELLPAIFDGSLQPTAQQSEKATYCSIIKKSDGIIDWHKSAEQLEREIRAYTGWPQSRTTLGGLEVIITDATVTGPFENTTPGKLSVIFDTDVKTLFIGTAEGQLEITELKPLGKQKMPIQAFLAGYRSQLGA